MLGLAFGWASFDRCPPDGDGPPQLGSLVRARGPLRAGAAQAPLEPPWPVVVGGYGPWHAEVSSAAVPLVARALVLEVGGQRVGLVQVDTLLVTDALTATVRAAAPFPVALVATHTHSSLGAYDARLAAQATALGRYRPEVEAAVADAAKAALALAQARLAPATVAVGGGESAGLSVPRSGDAVDARLTQVRLTGPGGAAVAQLQVISAHPTLVPRRPAQLDPDWPGRAAAAEGAAHGVTFVLQGAAGNASATGEPEGGGTSPERFAARVEQAFAGLDAGAPADEVELAWASATVGLPHPDGARLVPRLLAPVVENALCAGPPLVAEVAALRLGPVGFLLVPSEPSFAAGLVLEEQSGAQRVLGLADGYVGYVELDQAVRAGTGEARRQYFPPELLGQLGQAARLVGAAAGLRPR